MDENRIVRLIQRQFERKNSSVIRGIGDDAAVLRLPGSHGYWVVTTDMLLEDIDFRASWLTPAQLGHKSLAVNLSDIAAMGAKPRFFTVALALPATVTGTWIESCYRGMSKLALRHGAVLIGGDLSRSPGGVQVTITAIGECDEKPVYRSGGRPGDVLFVTGILGRAAAGLQLLLRGQFRGANLSQRQALSAQRMPEPRCDVGVWLARSGLVRSMMDLSDGLSLDLHRLCLASGVAANIATPPLYRGATLAQGLDGGEDYELLFTLAPGTRVPEAFEGVPLTRIGEIRPGTAGAVLLAGHPLKPGGWDHFRT
jgi:thiamine-monophosphate kinase